MHAIQTRYAVTLAAYETALAAYGAELDATVTEPTADASDAEWQAWSDADEALREAYSLDVLQAAVTAAADALIAWSLDVARRTAQDDRRALLDIQFLADSKSLTVRAELVSIAMRLEVAA